METTVSNELQERAFKILLALPGNYLCADCPLPSPDWASVPLGVFVCLKCSGVHRKIGLHITRIKSTKLDSWSLKHMYMANHVNNKDANRYWQANLPSDHSKITLETSTEDLSAFIYNKYVHRKFANPEQRPPLEQLVENLGADKGVDEDKTQYFQRKLTELEGSLNTKATMLGLDSNSNSNSGSNSQNKNYKNKDTTPKITKSLSPESRRISKEGSTPFLNILPAGQGLSTNPSLPKANNPFEKIGIPTTPMRRSFCDLGQSPASFLNVQPVGQGLFSDAVLPKVNNPFEKTDIPTTPMRRSFYKSVEPVEGSSFALFEGLTLKTIDSVPPKLNGTPEETLNLENRTSAPPLHNTDSKARFKNGKSVRPGDGPDFEMSAISYASSRLQTGKNYQDEYFMENTNNGNIREAKNGSRSGSDDSEEPFFLRLADGNMAKHGTHLKRPSEGFVTKNFDTDFNEDGARRHNLIRPSDAYHKGVILFGSLVIHFGFGYIYLWGSIAPYISYFLSADDSQPHYTLVASLIWITLFTVNYTTRYTEPFVNRFGFRKSTFLCFLAASLLLFFMSFTEVSALYCLVSTFIVGVFLGIGYNIPFYCSMQYFSAKVDYLKSLFYLAEGLGAFFFIYSSYNHFDSTIPELIGTTTMGGEDPESVTALNTTPYYYPPSVVTQVPGLIRLIAVNIFIISLIGSFMLRPKFKFVRKDWSFLIDKDELEVRNSRLEVILRRKGPKNPQNTPRAAITSTTSKCLIQITLFSCILGAYYFFIFKVEGLRLGYTDEYLSILGGVGILLMSVGKIIAVYVAEKYFFPTCVKVILVANVLLAVIATALPDILWLYFLPLMVLNGFILSLVREEVDSVFKEEISGSVTAFMMIGFAGSIMASFVLASLGILVLDQNYLNLVMIVPLVMALRANIRYANELKLRRTSGNDFIRIMQDDKHASLL